MRNAKETHFEPFVYGNTIDEIEANAMHEARAAFGYKYDITAEPISHMGRSYGSKEGKYCAHVPMTAVKKAHFEDDRI